MLQSYELSKTLLRGAAVFLGLCASADAAVLMECGASKGSSYILEGGILPADRALQDWVSDGVTGGKIALIQDGEIFDIVTTDASGSTFSYRPDGAKVVALNNTPGEWLIVSYWPDNVLETHYFNRLSHGGEVLWLQHKFGEAPIKKSGAFRAACTAEAAQ